MKYYSSIWNQYQYGKCYQYTYFVQVWEWLRLEFTINKMKQVTNLLEEPSGRKSGGFFYYAGVHVPGPRARAHACMLYGYIMLAYLLAGEGPRPEQHNMRALCHLCQTRFSCWHNRKPLILNHKPWFMCRVCQMCQQFQLSLFIVPYLFITYLNFKR